MQVDMIPGQGNIAQESCLDKTAIMKGIIDWISNAYMHIQTNTHFEIYIKTIQTLHTVWINISKTSTSKFYTATEIV